MPRYFFDIHDGVDTIDQDGTILRDVAHAKTEAAVFAASLLRDDPARFWNGEEWTVRVRDERRLVLFEITFSANLSPALVGAGPQRR